MPLNLKSLLGGLGEEVAHVVAMLREKGPKHFARPLGIAGGAVVALYVFVYVPTEEALAQAQKRLLAARATGQFASDYKSASSKLLEYAARLPQPSDKDGWLFNTIVESAQRNGITLGNVGSQTETETPGYVVLSMQVTASATYAQLGTWIASLEGSKRLLHVASVRIHKDKGEGPATAERLGKADAQIEISTVIPRARAAT